MTLFEKIMSIKNEDLDSMDMSYYPQKYSKVHSYEFSKYYSWKSGQEHYRFLNYVSTCMENQLLLDIGTFNGWSSIALGSNKSNTVISFDVVQQGCVKLIDEPNITFRLENILEDKKNEELILQSPFIFLDTYHDGTFEQEFLDRLLAIGYKGVVGFDDIYLNDEMKEFWERVSLTKYDATNIGHASGTGIVLFA